jgi:DNA replication and repair protein RecF
MHLQRIETTNFRNLSGALELSSRLNLIYGPNAQGKSSWLEAVSLLGTLRSFRTAHPKEAIRHGEKETIVRGLVVRGALTKDLQLLIAEGAKQTFINGKREPVSRYLGHLDAITFNADELDVVRGAPEARRRFLDRAVFAVLPSYLGTLNEYNRVLKQKNALLREAADAPDAAKYAELLQPWNDQLAALGAEIHQARLRHLDRLQQQLKPELFQTEEITIHYKSSLEGRGDLADYAALLAERLQLRMKNEIAAGHSLVGPHRDDIEIRCDGREIAKYGSSGQQRSALLILDLAQMNVYYQEFQEYPIFLIDDFDAELDRTRIEILLDHLEGKSQTIVSTSKRVQADRYRERAATFLVQNGHLIEEQDW